MSLAHLAQFVKNSRTERSWTQQQLADITATDIRTIQRIEAAAPCSPETMMALASAFEIDVTFLIGVKNLDDSVLNEIAQTAMQEELKKQGLVLHHLLKIEHPKEICNIFASCQAHSIEYMENLTAEQRKVFADFAADIEDYTDIYSEFSIHQRLETEDHFQQHLQNLKHCGLAAFGATDKRKLHGMNLTVFHCVVVQENYPKISVCGGKSRLSVALPIEAVLV